MIRSQDGLYLTYSRILVIFSQFTLIGHVLGFDKRDDFDFHIVNFPFRNPEHLVMLLAGPVPHTSTQYIDFVDFYISLDLSTIYFTHFSGC